MDFESVWSKTHRVKMVVMWEIMPMVFIRPDCKIGGEGEKCDSRGRRNMRGGEEGQITSSPHPPKDMALKGRGV
ncbi:hypothetical protein PRUPE_1G158900 [Prunus persica]|uniref:Uncharacterized protein n=1 Tax=Prunus persica TaxID=3760 RepID=A0A251QYB6_PRUPE|nr:hypothetical protein PRUPE_1G158900 [Prunus persica]